MKKLAIATMVLFLVFSLMGCQTEKEKEFSGTGVTITLNDTFIEKEVIQAPLYLESQNYIFTGLRESTSLLQANAIYDLEGYIKAVLKNNNHGDKTYEPVKDDKDNVLYYYAYYTARVEDMDFGYMVLVMKGSNHYYTMNFGCLEKKLETSKDQFFTWAKSISVE